MDESKRELSELDEKLDAIRQSLKDLPPMLGFRLEREEWRRIFAAAALSGLLQSKHVPDAVGAALQAADLLLERLYPSDDV